MARRVQQSYIFAGGNILEQMAQLGSVSDAHLMVQLRGDLSPAFRSFPWRTDFCALKQDMHEQFTTKGKREMINTDKLCLLVMCKH